MQAIIQFLELAGLAIMGFFVITGIFGNKNKDRIKEKDDLADSLITRLQQTVDQQSKDMESMKCMLNDQQKQISILQGQNEAYQKLITLRDPATEKVFKEAPDIFHLAREGSQIQKATLQSVEQLSEKIIELIVELRPLLEHFKVSSELNG